MFPVINVRRYVNGDWNLLYIEESVTVPSSSLYEFELTEVPDNGDSSDDTTNDIPLVIPGLTVTNVYPPTTGQVYVNYGNGTIAFNAAQSGNVYTAKYYGKGSLIKASHINTLEETKVGLSSDSTSGFIAIFTSGNDVTGTQDLDFGAF